MDCTRSCLYAKANVQCQNLPSWSIILYLTFFFNFQYIRVRLVYVFKNWKLLFENICGNTCGWKSTLKYVKYCLKIENSCLKAQTKHPLNFCICCLLILTFFCVFIYYHLTAFLFLLFLHNPILFSQFSQLNSFGSTKSNTVPNQVHYS